MNRNKKLTTEYVQATIPAPWAPFLLKYISGIRNSKKRAYALAWVDYRLNNQPLPENECGLSYMGAQAVRMQIDDILHI